MAGLPLRILSIDDDYYVRQSTERVLALLGGHQVESAENGREGLLKALEFRPDVILLDMSMPDMSGAEVMAELRKDPHTRHVPVVIVTGSRMSKAEAELLKNNTNFMWLEEKPVAWREFLARLESALAWPASRGVRGNCTGLPRR